MNRKVRAKLSKIQWNGSNESEVIEGNRKFIILTAHFLYFCFLYAIRKCGWVVLVEARKAEVELSIFSGQKCRGLERKLILKNKFKGCPIINFEFQ